MTGRIQDTLEGAEGVSHRPNQVGYRAQAELQTPGAMAGLCPLGGGGASLWAKGFEQRVTTDAHPVGILVTFACSPASFNYVNKDNGLKKQIQGLGRRLLTAQDPKEKASSYLFDI